MCLLHVRIHPSPSSIPVFTLCDSADLRSEGGSIEAIWLEEMTTPCNSRMVAALSATFLHFLLSDGADFIQARLDQLLHSAGYVGRTLEIRKIIRTHCAPCSIGLGETSSNFCSCLFCTLRLRKKPNSSKVPAAKICAAPGEWGVHVEESSFVGYVCEFLLAYCFGCREVLFVHKCMEP